MTHRCTHNTTQMVLSLLRGHCVTFLLRYFKIFMKYCFFDLLPLVINNLLQTVQDLFQLIPGLTSCPGVTGR